MISSVVGECVHIQPASGLDGFLYSFRGLKPTATNPAKRGIEPHSGFCFCEMFGDNTFVNKRFVCLPSILFSFTHPHDTNI